MALYRIRLDVGRGEARRSLELLSNRQLAEDVARTREELARVQVEDLTEPLAQVLAELGMSHGSLAGEERDTLLHAMAAVHMQLDQEDLAYAQELLARRQQQSVDLIVGQVIKES